MGLEADKATIILIVCQCMYAGVNLMSKAALVEEMSSRVFVVYRQFIAFLLIAPFAYFTRTETQRCWMGWKSFWFIFLLSFVSVTLNQNLYFEGLYLASSSAASALGNLVPTVTFIMAYTMGLEKLNLRSLRSIAKITGTLVCVSGAITMALVKGPKLLNVELVLPRNSIFHLEGEDTWLLGCLLCFASTCCWSIGLILQVHAAASYPDHLSLTAWMCLMASLQSGMLAFIFEPNAKAWKLDSSLQILCCFYAGSVSAVAFFGQIWCVSRKGPFFCSMFNPLCAVVVTVVACAFLHEEMYTGRLIGALAVIVGLYIVLWGKAAESEESRMKKQKDQITTLCDQISGNASCNIDLEEPLLSEKLADSGDEIDDQE